MVQAEKVDAGKISIAEGAAEVARVAFEVQQQSARTKAAILSAMPITHSTTCTGYGGTVSCFGQ